MRWGILAALLLAGACGDSPGPAGGTDTEGTGGTSTGMGTGTSGTGTGATSGPSTATDSGSVTSTVGSTGETSTSTGTTGGARPGTVAACFEDAFVNYPEDLLLDYDQFMPVVGSHCLGTNHQDITGVERVVFLGDSVTVGTPPSLSDQFYRSVVADGLASRFGLDFASDETLWKLADPFGGTTVVQDAGDFSSCAKWGARNDDFLMGGNQIADCFAPETLGLRTLVVLTMGGNDLSALTQAAIDGVPDADLWTMTEEIVQNHRDAIEWLTEPNRFPNGVFVVFSNMFEFTDGTGDVEVCDVSGLAGFDQPVPAPDKLADMVIWANEQYAATAVQTGTDMVFMLEEFCGHGFNNDNPMAPCYRGPNTPRWVDLTCIHPNPTGHQELADMFLAVVDE